LNTATFAVGRDASGYGVLNLYGGLLNATATTFGLAANGDVTSTGSGIVNIGGGILELDNLTTLTIGTAAPSYFNFLTSGAGVGALEFNGFSQANFDSLITSGDILVDGATAAPNEFNFSTSGNDGVFQLAPGAVPEPSSLAMMGGGIMGLYLIACRRK
jgi:hypothetical protein